ncbi:MAG: triose-phosphate isomerase [Acidobacteriota bacterium]|nr:triose-phosphate isomerase [Acidobacteriota bacterium]
MRSQNPRRLLIGGNWKMNLLSRQARDYCQAFVSGWEGFSTEVVLFVSSPLLPAVAESLASGPIGLGGQDLHPESKGAFTGDVSGPQLADAGCSWVLCGHSERRRDHGESDRLVGRKAAAAVSNSLTPLICVGETEEERERQETFSVLKRQLETALESRPEPFALAYEPVWAIGTGRSATPEMAQQAHQHLRETLADLLGDEAAATKRILYGGSANPENAAALISQPDIDGFLVGGASLDPERFLAMIRCCG